MPSWVCYCPVVIASAPAAPSGQISLSCAPSFPVGLRPVRALRCFYPVISLWFLRLVPSGWIASWVWAVRLSRAPPRNHRPAGIMSGRSSSGIVPSSAPRPVLSPSFPAVLKVPGSPSFRLSVGVGRSWSSPWMSGNVSGSFPPVIGFPAAAWPGLMSSPISRKIKEVHHENHVV
ncbi:MAG: hypothetical protein BWZ01_03104 [Deltaproteobacteria bacterium ADurb.BinA179]|nr:MAG: hypothetical protein BWZ01_03104 [Deltaproteobacteria bacterium ADurb.BinA179]